MPWQLHYMVSLYWNCPQVLSSNSHGQNSWWTPTCPGPTVSTDPVPTSVVTVHEASRSLATSSNICAHILVSCKMNDAVLLSFKLYNRLFVEYYVIKFIKNVLWIWNRDIPILDNFLWPPSCGLLTPYWDKSILAQLMAWCHHLNQCWLIISKVQWHSSEAKFTAYVSVT